MTKLTDQEKIDIVIKYIHHSISCDKLAIEYKCSKSNIRGILIRRGVKLRNRHETSKKYTINEHYFDIIDDEHKAYWLGLLYADGCNHINNKSVSIGLEESDRYILEEFKKDLQSNKPLYYQKEYKSGIDKKYLSKPQYKLVISNKYISNRLKELGCVPQKSLTLKFPNQNQVPNHLMNHFIRGYFDGDGWIPKYIRKNNVKVYQIGIMSSHEFCQSLYFYLLDNLSINVSIEIRGNSSVINVRNKNSYDIFSEWLYKDATIYFERKYQNFIFNKQEVKFGC
jgi:hypothetical protein